MHAYAFLTEGGIAPLSGFAWPPPTEGGLGAWVDQRSAPRDVVRGCGVADLPYWIDDELWRIELAGVVKQRDHVLLAERGRLLRRIEPWVDEVAWAFVSACTARLAERVAAALRSQGNAAAALAIARAADPGELERAVGEAAGTSGSSSELAGYLADACLYARDAGIGPRAASVVAIITADAIATASVRDGLDAASLASERAWQAAWLAERLDLSILTESDSIRG